VCGSEFGLEGTVGVRVIGFRVRGLGFRVYGLQGHLAGKKMPPSSRPP